MEIRKYEKKNGKISAYKINKYTANVLAIT